jgi:ABC-type dipeptide/oligopeptide/nickel transport system permease subunit
MVNPPQDQARKALGGKNVSPAQIAHYLHEKGYDIPRFYNAGEISVVNRIENTIFFHKFIRLFVFDLGNSDSDGHIISKEISKRIYPSLLISVPSMALSLVLTLSLSLLLAYRRGSRLDLSVAALAVLMMSISVLFYIIGLQFVFGRFLRWIPISGWTDGFDVWRFVLGSVVISVVASLAGGIRFYRSVFLEEMSKEYLRTARAKGLSEWQVLVKHVLPNALIPVVTSVVSSLPFLIIGSMLLESFFAIPGLGNYTLDGLNNKDFAVVRSMVFLGSILTMIGLLLTDIAYRVVDPRVSFSASGTFQESRFKALPVFFGVLVFVFALALWGHLTDPLCEGLNDKTFTAVSVVKTPAPTLLKSVVVNNVFVGLITLLFFYSIFRISFNHLFRQFVLTVRINFGLFISTSVVALYLLIALLDSLYFRVPLLDSENQPLREKSSGAFIYQQQTSSVLDDLFLKIVSSTSISKNNPNRMNTLSDFWEKSYSEPLAKTLSVKTTDPISGSRVYQDLKFPRAHLFGTDKAGVDTFYRTLKGIRTAVIIGIMTTLIALPFALCFGMMAGYFGSWIDDLVQYVYTTLSAIPGVLLVMSFILIFGPGLFQICIILGITGWVELCRLIRGETMKLREQTFIQAAKSMGSSHFFILFKHLLPNLSHLTVISLVLSFSGLVLSEATLSYLGIGVDASTGSWGNMINDARMELSREPLIWWPLSASFAFMFFLILPANIISDHVQSILNPKSKV